MKKKVDGFSVSAEDSRDLEVKLTCIYSPSVSEYEWAAELGGGAGMKERSGWIQPDLKLHSYTAGKGQASSHVI